MPTDKRILAVAPVAAGGSFTVVEDGLYTGVLPTATDADGDFSGYRLVTPARAGVVELSSNGSFGYTPAPDFHGSDQFEFAVVDRAGNSSVYTMFVTVAAANDPPHWRTPLPAVTTPAGVARSVSLPAAAVGDVDGDAPTLSASLGDGSPLPAWLSFDAAARRFVANPQVADVGTLQVRLRASDGVASSDTVFAWTVASLQARSIAGLALDSASAGARLFIDLNGNQRAELFEDSGLVSDAAGRFAGTVHGSGAWLVVPGAVGQLAWSAPASAVVVTPLTTLVQRLVVDHDLSLAEAQARVRNALDLPAGVDLLGFDTGAQPDTHATAVLVQRAASQVAVVVAQVGDADLVLDALADQAAGWGELLLTDADALADLIPLVADDDGLFDTIAALNLQIEAAGSRSAIAAALAPALARFAAWDAEREPASVLTAALAGGGSGLAIDSASVQVGYGLGSADNGAVEASIARYAGGVAGLAIGAGLLLSTGDATPRARNAESRTSAMLDPVLPGPAGTALLAELQKALPSAASVADVTSLAFRFTVADPALRFVQLNVLLATDEYPEFGADSPYADVAAVWVNGVNVALFDANRPLALIEATRGEFASNAAGTVALEYDGLSRLLTLTAPVLEGVNTIRIAIGDVGDAQTDSALFVAGLRAVDATRAGYAQLDGSPGADTLAGGAAPDLLVLGGGHDRGEGGGGGDVIDGGRGDDTLAGGAGADTLIGGTGEDTALFGGAYADYRFDIGFDTGFDTAGGPPTLRVSAAAGTSPPDAGTGAAGDLLVGIETLSFSDRPAVSVTSLMTPPAVPLLASISDDVGPSTGGLSPGARTDDNRPLLAGTATAATTVVLFDGGAELARVTADGSGAWTWTPTGVLAEGVHSFTLRALNAAGLASAATAPFNLVVDAINAAPRAAAATATLAEDGRIDAALLPAASDDDGDVVTYALDLAATRGAATVNPDGSFSYVPLPDANGSDSFRFRVSDPRGGSATYTVSLTVQPVNDAPSGRVTITGSVQPGQVLGVAQTVADADGLGSGFTTQWLRGGVAIAGATGGSYTLQAGDAGQVITVRLGYTDGGGTAETVSSAAVAFGSAGDDRLTGTALDDWLSGGAGHDVFDPREGRDTLAGGEGLDVVRLGGDVGLLVDLAAGSAGRTAGLVTLSGIEGVIGSSVADRMSGAEQPAGLHGDSFRGAGGDDTLDGRGGIDTAEYAGARAGYTVTRSGNPADPSVVRLTVSDTVPGDGADGSDQLVAIERLLFADRIVAFGTRAEEVARVAYVLWSPAIVTSSSLFGFGLYYYDLGFSFEELSVAALGYFAEPNAALARRLWENTQGTRSEQEILALIEAGGGGSAGRAAAVRSLALDAATTAHIEASGIRTAGLVGDLRIDTGELFVPMPG